MTLDDENPNDNEMQLVQLGKKNYTQKRIHTAFVRSTEKIIDGNNIWLWVKKNT